MTVDEHRDGAARVRVALEICEVRGVKSGG